jgi:diguanylate cyclase (GGDEF)-like protein
MSPAPQDLSTLGTRLRKRVHVALALSSVVPLLVLAYVVQGYLLPNLDPADTYTFFGMQTLVLFTVIGMLAGGWVIWGLGRTVAQMANMLTRDNKGATLATKTDEVGALMSNFVKMFETIERQTAEINTFATRLDSAYKELESANARLKETSFKDEVTGVYNRRFFTIRLDEEISRYRRFNHPISIVVLDLDGFKLVNDELGHAAGDDTLRGVGQILTKHSRGVNVVSRYGGDEFAVLLVETSKAGARIYADRIRAVIAEYQFPHGRSITSSLGIASLPEDDVTTAEELFKVADEALYVAKRGGRNQVAALKSVVGDD